MKDFFDECVVFGIELTLFTNPDLGRLQLQRLGSEIEVDRSDAGICLQACEQRVHQCVEKETVAAETVLNANAVLAAITPRAVVEQIKCFGIYLKSEHWPTTAFEHPVIWPIDLFKRYPPTRLVDDRPDYVWKGGLCDQIGESFMGL